MALRARQPLRKKQPHPAPRRVGHRARVVLPDPAIVGRVSREKRPLEARDGLAHRRQIDRLARKGGAEGRRILRIRGQARQHFRFAAREPQLDRILVEHGAQLLLLQSPAVGVHPRQGGVVGDVGEAHASARMAHPGRPSRPIPPVGEGELGRVAGSAGLRPVGGETRVVEEPPTQRDLGLAHGIVFRHARHREAWRQLPVEGDYGRERGRGGRAGAGLLRGRRPGRNRPGGAVRTAPRVGARRREQSSTSAAAAPAGASSSARRAACARRPTPRSCPTRPNRRRRVRSASSGSTCRWPPPAGRPGSDPG